MRFLIFLSIVILSSALKMKLTLQAQQTKCFYQMLMAHQKYAVQIAPIHEGTYQLSITHQINNSWQHSVHRKTTHPNKNTTLYKLAKHSTVYSYCITNLERYTNKLRVDLKMGLELLDLKVVAQESDQQFVLRQAKWIDKQTDKIIQNVKRSYVKRENREEYANLMRKKMIGYAVIGLVALAGISFVFYTQMRKTFKDRKMI